MLRTTSNKPNLRTEYIEKVTTLITSVKGKIVTPEELQDKTIDLAGFILKEAQSIQTQTEKLQQELIARMMKDPVGKIFTTAMTDQCFRSSNNSRVADQLTYIFKKYGVPKYLPWNQRWGMRFFKTFGKFLSSLLIPLIKKMIRKKTATVILPAENRSLMAHMAKRRKEGIRVNLNHLGEAILGEEEALRRLETYIDDLQKPEIECVSIKISTICSQINLLAWEETLEILAERLRRLYRTAQNNLFMQTDGTLSPKLINLDMEEYRDVHLTTDLFCRVLSEPEFHTFSAGIVLQSYLPDSFLLQQKLTAWALERLSKGGAPIRIRLVKGANLAMEQVEAALHHWPQAPYTHKLEADANYKRMLKYGCMPARAKAVHLGVGSHNLFDISYALLLRSQNNVEPYISFEMLEGMADSIRRAVQNISPDILLYCPTAKKEEFQNAVAYLVRRLDENTAPENFLRCLFGLHPGSSEWKHQSHLFTLSCQESDAIQSHPKRTQNRLHAIPDPNLYAPFDNEPDTDWSIHDNMTWAQNIRKTWIHREISPIPIVIEGQTIHRTQDTDISIGLDPSVPNKELFRYTLATEHDINLALNSAEKVFPSWSTSHVEKRSLLLAKIAQEIRKNRGELIGAMMANTGKTITEADSEISEAIDFAEYYRRNIEELHNFEDIHWEPRGTVLIAPPWNFPCSIPTGGILAALAAGNCVLFKPAPEAVLVGWVLAQIFWEAGISQEVLQFIPCSDDPTGSYLIKSPRIATVILTGATATAKHFLQMRPSIHLLAETGGKNAIIITNLSDHDLAIKNLLTSAFGHSGQKCSACSLAILEAELYDDPHFRNQLRDAAQSLFVGSAWDLRSKVIPLIRAPQSGSPLYRALTQLEPHEEWLLQPKQDPDNPNLWSPGIKMGVKRNSFTHQTEFFGPVLGIMRATSLLEAIELANGTRYGLTAGLHSLDEREKQLWMRKIEAGNCYINRSITGAIVQRQPFGGCKESSFGPGMKAGGPNYLINLMQASQKSLPREKSPLSPTVETLLTHLSSSPLTEREMDALQASFHHYAYYWSTYFCKKHDPSILLGQDNFLSYLPHRQLLLRLNDVDTLFDALCIIGAAITLDIPLEISGEQHSLNSLFSISCLPQLKITLTPETENDLIRHLSTSEIKRVRMISPPSDTLQIAFAKEACNVTIAKPLANGRLELLHFLREMSLSSDYHRYGNLGERENEKRKPLPVC